MFALIKKYLQPLISLPPETCIDWSLDNCMYILSPIVIENNEILYRDYVDISVAVATPKVRAASGP